MMHKKKKGSRKNPTLSQLQQRNRQKSASVSPPSPTDDGDSSSQKLGYSRRRWGFEERTNTSYALVTPNRDISPLGYLHGQSALQDTSLTKVNEDSMVYASAMELAKSAGKQLPMTMIMLWMSGSSFQIFSISILYMALSQPIQKLLNMSKEFSRYAKSKADLSTPKMIYIALNLVGLGLGLFKCKQFGILPGEGQTGAGIFLRPGLEMSSGGIIF